MDTRSNVQNDVYYVQGVFCRVQPTSLGLLAVIFLGGIVVLPGRMAFAESAKKPGFASDLDWPCYGRLGVYLESA